MRSLLDAVLALPFTLLPRRYWQSFDLPVAGMAPLSGFLTLFTGFAVGIPGYFAYLERLRGVRAVSILEISRLQVEGTLPETAAVSAVPGAIYAIAPLAFALFTPIGLLATYLILGSIFRIASSYVDDAHGDPVLTALDSIGRRMRRSRRERTARIAREALEGTAEADRLYTGEWAGLPDATYAVVAARRKAEWTKGTFVITSQGWFTLGEPFDRPMPHGLRTVYPLTLQTTPDVVRKSVQYELPPLRSAYAAAGRSGETSPKLARSRTSEGGPLQAPKRARNEPPHPPEES